MSSDPTPQVYRPPIAIVKCVVSMMVHHIKHQLWQLLLINTPTFDVPPGCHIVTKHLDKVFSAGGCMKWPAEQPYQPWISSLSWVEYAENAVGVMVILQATTGPTAGNEQQY